MPVKALVLQLRQMLMTSGWGLQQRPTSPLLYLFIYLFMNLALTYMHKIRIQ